MELIIKTHHQEMFNQLKSIPGMVSKTSLLLIVISGGFSKFNNHKQLALYFVISPRIYKSGTNVKVKSKICKMGMSKTRACFTCVIGKQKDAIKLAKNYVINW